MSMANNWNKLKGMNIQHTITGHPLLNGVLWLVADEDWGEAKGELGRVKWRKSRWRLFIKCDLVGRYASSNSFLRESKFGWLVRVVRMVVRGLVRRVVRGVVRGVGVSFFNSPPRNTLRDFIAIAELKRVDSRAFEIALANYQGESVRELEQMCRKSLRHYMLLVSTMRRDGQLLPLKFDQRFYEWSFTCNKNGSFRSHHVFKSQWPIIKINW